MTLRRWAGQERGGGKFSWQKMPLKASNMQTKSVNLAESLIWEAGTCCSGGSRTAMGRGSPSVKEVKVLVLRFKVPYLKENWILFVLTVFIRNNHAIFTQMCF